MSTPPTCFLSYSWDSDEHREWVRALATRLRGDGVEALLDQFQLSPGADVVRFMEAAVRGSDFVVLICTPNFASKADAGSGGVGYEKAIVTGEIFVGEVRETKFVPLLRAGDARKALPGYLKTRLFVDFRDDTRFEAAYEQLVRHLYGAPLHPLPPLGRKPEFAPASGKVPKSMATAESAPPARDAPQNRSGAREQQPGARPGSERQPAQPLFFEGFDDDELDFDAMRRRYGEQWIIGEDGPWMGEVRDGRYLLENRWNPNAVRYIFVGMSAPDDQRIELGDARASLQVELDPSPGVPQVGAGILYRFNEKKQHYLALVLAHLTADGAQNPYVGWVCRDDLGFCIRHLEPATWLEPGRPVLLSITGRGPEIELRAQGNHFHTLTVEDQLVGDPGLIAFGTGRFRFDNFTIWPKA